KRGVFEVTVTVDALIEELMDARIVDRDRLQATLATERKNELDRMRDGLRVRIDPTDDKYALAGLPDIDCDARIPLCRGRCCTLHFALSRQDLLEHVVEWEHMRPYIIRQADDGYCVHNDRDTRFCGIYERRPAVCRRYDCRKDKRIWIDFEARIPTTDPSLTPAEAPTPRGPPPNTLPEDGE